MVSADKRLSAYDALQRGAQAVGGLVVEAIATEQEGSAATLCRADVAARQALMNNGNPIELLPAAQSARDLALWVCVGADGPMGQVLEVIAQFRRFAAHVVDAAQRADCPADHDQLYRWEVI